MNIIFILIFSIFDAVIFPNRDRFPKLFWFTVDKQGNKIYWIYRAFQFLIFAWGFYMCMPDEYPSELVQLSHTLLPLMAYLLGFVLLLTDGIYYTITGGWNGLMELHIKKGWAYWLMHPYQIGSLIFRNGFNIWLFILSNLIAVAILIISDII